MMMPTVVCIAVIFTLNICDAFINNPRWAFYPTFRQPESYTRPLSEEKQPFRRLREDHSLVLSMTENIDDEPFINVVKKKQKRKSRANAEIMKYSDEVIQSWKMSDSFNSTTMRLLFNFRVSGCSII